MIFAFFFSTHFPISLSIDKTALRRCVCKLPFGSVNVWPGAGECVSRCRDEVEQ